MIDNVPVEKRGVSFEFVVGKAHNSDIGSILRLVGVHSLDVKNKELFEIFRSLLLCMVRHAPNIFLHAVYLGFFNDLPRYPFHTFREMHSLDWSQVQIRDYGQKWEEMFHIVRKLEPDCTVLIVPKYDDSNNKPIIHPDRSRYMKMKWLALCLDFGAIASMFQWNAYDTTNVFFKYRVKIDSGHPTARYLPDGLEREFVKTFSFPDM